MTAAAAALMPLVDEGRLGGPGAFLRELRPRPGRFGDTLRLVVLVVLAVTLAEVFRIPEPGVCAYVVLFVSRGERASTVKAALGAGIAVVLAVFATVAVFMISLSQPALRVPLIALITFAAMALSRASSLGAAAFAFGFIVAYGLTIGDEVLGVALQSSDVSNTVTGGVPELLSVPPEEALLHALLWLAVVVTMPVGLVVAGNLLTGRRPLALLREALAARLEASARFCAGDDKALPALATSAREGRAVMQGLLERAGRQAESADFGALIRETEQLAVVLLTEALAGRYAAEPLTARPRLQPLAASLLAAAVCVRDGRAAPPPAPNLREVEGPVGSISNEAARAMIAINRALLPGEPDSAMPRRRHAAPPRDDEPAPPRDDEPAPPRDDKPALLSAAKLRSPDTVRFAFKVTLAVMLSYAAESLLDWPEIHTCVVTCFFVSLGTVGESVHKAALRLAGALVGGALGIGTILTLMPLMTDLGDLLLAVAAVTALAGWIASGSDRISYAGWQIGIAYYLTVLQGYGPTLDMQTARDRVIGILLGNVIVFVVFSTIWPVRVAQPVRRHLAAAIGRIGGLLRLDRALAPDDPGSQPASQAGFIVELEQARALLSASAYEAGSGGRALRPRLIDGTVLVDLEGIMLIVTALYRLKADPTWAAIPEAERRPASAYDGALAAWFDDCAAWIRAGTGGVSLAASLPAPPALEGSGALATRAHWYRLLDARLRTVIGMVMQGADLGTARPFARG